jgi:ubiquinone/menaquinone biosynthesis C-methylase UbiE
VSDLEAFRKFEHAGWEAIPDPYHQAFGALTSQGIESLLDSVGVATATKMLDIASGPGYAAAAACARGASVVAVDFSASMVAAARRRYPDIEFHEADAEKLPFNSGVFDAAVMNFGILHLPRPESALAEAFRVLRSGGKFAFTAWADPAETIGFRIVLRAVEAHGDINVRLPPGPPFFRFSDSEEAARALRTAGFEATAVAKIPQRWRLPAGDGLFEAMKESTVRTAGLLRAQKPAALETIREAIRGAVETYRIGDCVELSMPAILASATKPSRG